VTTWLVRKESDEGLPDLEWVVEVEFPYGSVPDRGVVRAQGALEGMNAVIDGRQALDALLAGYADLGYLVDVTTP
jgi:hypothetical protein